MNSTGIEKIRYCGTVQELRELWESKVDEWSQLPKEQARALIRAKDEHKAKLLWFEELTFSQEERAAIMEFDGGLSKKEAESYARKRRITT